MRKRSINLGSSVRRFSEQRFKSFSVSERPKIISLPNGKQNEESERTFSNSEMERRMSNLQKSVLDSENLDFALFTSYENVNYYGDFLYCSFNRPYAFVISNGDTVNSCINTLISANIDGGQGYRRIGGYQGSKLNYQNVIFTDWQKDNYFYAVSNSILKCIKNNSSKMIRIGYEGEHLSVNKLNKLKTYVNNELMNSNGTKVEFIDISDKVMHLRMLKSKEEISLIENGAKIANIGGYQCIETLSNALKENIPIREFEVSNKSTEAMISAISDDYPHGELRDTWTWFQSGINTDGAHNPVTSKLVEKGDILSLNCFPMIAGYYTALERTLFYDHIPSDAHLKTWEINCKVHEIGMSLIKPGVRCCDIALELNEIFLESNLLQYRTFGYGHSFGVLSHYYGREGGLELREDCETVLKPGMVVSMEPMLMIPENMPGAGGYREHDILVVTDDGATNITNFPYGPENNVVSV